MKYRKVFITLFLILAGIGIIGWFKVQTAQNNAQIASPSLAQESFLTLDYIKEDVAIKSELASAELHAKRWQADAKLVAVSIKFEDGLNYEFLKQYNYVFSSEIEPKHYLLINNSRIKGAMQTFAESNLFEQIIPEVLPAEYLKVNFVQALELVERAGGGDFRIANSGHCGVALMLMQPQNSVLNWHISYYDKQGSSEKTWQVNATSGAIQEG